LLAGQSSDCIQQPLPELIERRSPMKDQIVTILDLGEEKPVLAEPTAGASGLLSQSRPFCSAQIECER
jgi:hypothetical protein